MASLISCATWGVITVYANRTVAECFSRVKRGVAARHPEKYTLDDQELARVSALAHIELEDARKELEAAHKAAGMMGKGAEGEEADDVDEDEDEDESAWVE